MVKETWTEVWTVVKVSDLGNVKIKKTARKAKIYDMPTFTNVKFKDYSTGIANVARRKPVICLNTNQWFESLSAACKYFKICPKKLSNCLRGNTPDTNGLHWAYYTE